MIRRLISSSPEVRSFARELRKSTTSSERRLWRYLRRRQIHGYRFHRQYSIGKYIVDFYCPELKCVIEIDGPYHQGRINSDEARKNYLQALGLKIVHFTDNDARENIEGVVVGIKQWIVDNTSHKQLDPPNPPIIRPCHAGMAWRGMPSLRGEVSPNHLKGGSFSFPLKWGVAP